MNSFSISVRIAMACAVANGDTAPTTTTTTLANVNAQIFHVLKEFTTSSCVTNSSDPPSSEYHPVGVCEPTALGAATYKKSIVTSAGDLEKTQYTNAACTVVDQSVTNTTTKGACTAYSNNGGTSYKKGSINTALTTVYLAMYSAATCAANTKVYATYYGANSCQKVASSDCSKYNVTGCRSMKFPISGTVGTINFYTQPNCAGAIAAGKSYSYKGGGICKKLDANMPTTAKPASTATHYKLLIGTSGG
jgi:hypothetical protein